MPEICDLPATELRTLFASGSLSPVEVMRSLQTRVERTEPYLSACWAIDFSYAFKAAEQSEARWRNFAPLSRLDGIPVSVKEMISTKGVPRPVGTAAGDMTPMPGDAPPAARMREAGAIIWGKTTNPDYGMLSSGLSSFHDLARNPWNLEMTPGGSSAGAGAACAAGYGPLHLGTDIGGSLRLPAGWCGIFTLKPSFGRVPIDPPFIGRVAGPMTRTVGDAAMLMTELSKPDARDYMSLPPSSIAWEELDFKVAGLRIGLMLDAGCGTPASCEVRSTVERAASLLAQAGAEIVEVGPVMSQELLDGLDKFWRTRFLSGTSGLPPDRYEKILPYIRQWGEGAKGFDNVEGYEAFSKIIGIQERGTHHFGGLDFLISPVSPEPAFPADWPSPSRDPSRPFEHIGFTVAYNMTGQPAASINCGFSATGLPIGLQIVGRRFDDLGVLRVARIWEEMMPDKRAWPEIGT